MIEAFEKMIDCRVSGTRSASIPARATRTRRNSGGFGARDRVKWELKSKGRRSRPWTHANLRNKIFLKTCHFILSFVSLVNLSILIAFLSFSHSSLVIFVVGPMTLGGVAAINQREGEYPDERCPATGPSIEDKLSVELRDESVDG